MGGLSNRTDVIRVLNHCCRYEPINGLAVGLVRRYPLPRFTESVAKTMNTLWFNDKNEVITINTFLFVDLQEENCILVQVFDDVFVQFMVSSVVYRRNS